MPGERFKVIFGGRNIDLREPKVELWLVPHDASPPEPQHYKTDIASFKGKFAELRAWDPGWEDLHAEFDAGTGPPVAHATRASFGDMLLQQRQATGYVVVYNGPDSVPGAWRRTASREVSNLRKFGIEADYLKTIYGGNAKNARVELWIVPRDAPAPVTDAGTESLPARAVLIGNLSDQSLGNEETQQSAFKDLVNALSVNENLRACLIARLESLAQKSEEDPESSSEPENLAEESADLAEESEDDATDPIVEVPPADLPELIQKWRVELASHKISSDRLVVLFAPAREFEGNALEAWIVPAGLPLPDPLAEPEDPEVVDDQADETKKPPQPKPSESWRRL
jgi:hypothetical protein